MRAILANLAEGGGHALVDESAVRAEQAELPFYRNWVLVRVARKDDRSSPAGQRFTYVLVHRDGQSLLLDGESDPIHTANEKEPLRLDSTTAPDYVRFFLFALRASGDAFVLFEAPSGQVLPALEKTANLSRPLEAVGTDEQGRFLFDAVVAFQGGLFTSRFAVDPGGEIEMTDDEPIVAVFPKALLNPAPVLGIAPTLLAADDRARAVAPPDVDVAHDDATSQRRSRSTLVELVGLLLTRALRTKSGDRLLSYFNAAQPSADVLETFAALVRDSSPVVVVESSIPFVEETIATVINDTLPESAPVRTTRLSVVTDSSGQDVLSGNDLSDHASGVVLLPLQVYRAVAHAERLAFDLATHDVAALISCERFADLPESLRRHTDLVLRLPMIDDEVFTELFRRVIGKSPPRRWRSGGTQWVKSVLHTDFEHPRRYQLSPDAALDFIRAQVDERLGAVDPVAGMSLKDLHGMGEARQWAEDVIADIHAARKGRIPWSQVDRGALFVGPPGTGKTTLAMAIAKDCGVRFVQGSAASWMAEGVSLGPHIQAIRRTFAEARRYSPSILFIDEIDSLGSRESFADDRNSVYQTEVVNAVLEQIQGMDPAAPVVVIGATNHEERVDPALRRAGRLDRVIRIPRPNAEGLSHIYRYHLAKLAESIEIAPNVDARTLGRLSVGLTGADVERIVRGASRRARKVERAVAQADLVDELTNKPRTAGGAGRLTEAEMARVAVHEAGHALAAFLSSSKGADIGFISIIPREDGTLGFVAPLSDDRLSRTRREYDETLEIYLAGRAAEELTFGSDEVTGGAGSDLMAASSLAISMVTRLGLGGNGKLLWTESASHADVDAAEDILRAAYDRVVRNLRRNERKLAALASELATRQELAGDAARSLLRGRRRVATDDSLS